MPDKNLVLVVDDERSLLELISTYLTRLGYQVHACASARQALERFTEQPSDYALVLVDMQMPDMPGPELIAELRARNPGVRAVLTSGHPPGSLHLPAGATSEICFLQKPFSPSQLADVIESQLAS